MNSILQKFHFYKMTRKKVQNAWSDRKDFPYTEQYARAFHLSQELKDIDFQTNTKDFQFYGN